MGEAADAEDSVAVLAVGFVDKAHVYFRISESPTLASVLDAPLRVTVAVRATVGVVVVAAATGFAFRTEAVTVVDFNALFSLPSLTISAAT